MRFSTKKAIGPTWHAHMLRGVYAAYLFKFDNPENTKINTFIKNKLCHTTIDASLSYTGYTMDFDDDLNL